MKQVTELMREYFEYDGIPWNRHIQSGLKTLLGNQKFGQVLLIWANADIAGYLILTYGFDLEFGGLQCVVTDLYIRPAFRRSGIGVKAIQFLLKYCKAKGMRTLELQVERHNRKAQRFYKAMGFTSHDRIPLSKWI